MNLNDEQLRALLKNWKDIEPRPSFEADVRRRIRLAETEQPVRAAWLHQWLRKPALGFAVAVAASIVIGASVGTMAAPHPNLRAELQFMSGGTLSGGYVKLASEGRR